MTIIQKLKRENFHLKESNILLKESNILLQERGERKDVQIRELTSENTQMKETIGFLRRVIDNMKTKFEKYVQAMQLLFRNLNMFGRM